MPFPWFCFQFIVTYYYLDWITWRRYLPRSNEDLKIVGNLTLHIIAVFFPCEMGSQYVTNSGPLCNSGWLLDSFYLMSMGVLLICMSVYYIMSVSLEIRRDPVFHMGAGKRTWASGRVTSAPRHWAISLASGFRLLIFLPECPDSWDY